MTNFETENKIKDFNDRVVAVVFNSEKSKVLLVKHEEKRKRGLYGLPGGEVKADENIEKALIRELVEETGIEAEHEGILRIGGRYSGVLNRDNNLGGNKNYFLNAFIVKDYHGNIRHGENTTPVWAKIDALSRKRLRLMPSVEQIVFDGLRLLE